MSYYGKYRGIVRNNLDPMQQARLILDVPDVLGPQSSSWALPCLPPGVDCILPAIGSDVWVEFEGGNPDYPIWCGVYWSRAIDVPERLRAPAPTQESGTTPTSITLATADGALLQMGVDGIVISNGKGATLHLLGPTISLNQGALVIT
ncbi:MAG: phage baseplate assembly protein V [Luteimonas sp.]